jgi:hypothetical protein
MQPMIAAAADLAAAGLAVFPVRPNRKEPALRDWQARATDKPEEAERLFHGYPGCNLGIVTGERSGVFVLDIDRKAVDGLTTLAELEDAHGQLPGTWEARTPSGGLHLWFAYPTDRRVTNRASFAPALDIRGVGGFVVAPPSCSAAGLYRWSRAPHQADLSEAPQWLLDLAAPLPPPRPEKPPARLPAPSGDRLARYVASAVAREVQRVEQAPVGQRNETLFKAAANLGELVGAGVLRNELAEVALTVAADACGLTHDDGRQAVASTIASGIGRGRANPREVRP